MALFILVLLIGGAIYLVSVLRNKQATQDIEDQAMTEAFEASGTPDPSPPPSVEENVSVDDQEDSYNTSPSLSNAESIELLAQAKATLEEERYAKTRELGFTLLERSKHNPSIREMENILGELHTQMVFSKMPMEEKIDYTIQSGDTLGALANTYGTTVELIRKGNNIRGHLIRVRDRIRILQGRFSVEVNKTKNDLVVRLNDRFFKRYSVGTGEHRITPTGDFKIIDRIEHPTWFKPDGRTIPYGSKENELGTHWLALDIPGYGIHGTWEPDTIGKRVSAGCIRLINEEVEELFALLPIGTPVKITE